MMQLFRTICADEAGGGPLSPAMAKHRGQTLRLTGQVIDAVNPGQLTYPEGMEVDEALIKLLPTPKASDGEKGGPNQRGSKGDLTLPSASVRIDVDWGPYAPAVRRWEGITGHPAPFPAIPDGRNGNHRLNAAFAEWMMGLEPGRVTNPAIGITRNKQLKAIGNGVVPRQAMAALGDMLANPLADQLPPRPARTWGIPEGWAQLTIYDALETASG